MCLSGLLSLPFAVECKASWNQEQPSVFRYRGQWGSEASWKLGVFSSHTWRPPRPAPFQGQSISLGTWNLPESGPSAGKQMTEWETEAYDSEWHWAARHRVTFVLCVVVRWALGLPFRMGHRKGKGLYLEYSRACCS